MRIRGRDNEEDDLDRTGGVREKKGRSFQRMVAQACQSLLRTQRHDSQSGPLSALGRLLVVGTEA